MVYSYSSEESDMAALITKEFSKEVVSSKMGHDVEKAVSRLETKLAMRDFPCDFEYAGCDANATCTKSGPGTAVCACNQGYTGSGMNASCKGEWAHRQCVNCASSLVCSKNLRHLFYL
jgi:hypothetical protein